MSAGARLVAHLNRPGCTSLVPRCLFAPGRQVKPDSTGVVTMLYSKGGKDRCVVAFPEQSGWEGIVGEMSVVGDEGKGENAVAGAMAVGARVKVEAGVSPSTGWGSVSAGGSP
jgi:hypothetical protein